MVVFPTSAEDVSKVVLFSIANSLEIAVCGGGHSSGGSSSTDGGVSIDLSKLRACTVDVEKKTISVEGGALWRDVDKALGEHGLAAVGGTVNHTGGDLPFDT
jgi:FAD/FMN-containing dehydrogenase